MYILDIVYYMTYFMVSCTQTISIHDVSIWVASSKKWEKLNILEIEADQLSEYCREFGLYYERSDKGMPKFDYESYLWDGNIPDKSIWYEEKSLPNSTNKED